MSIPAFYLPPEFWNGNPILEGGEASHAHAFRVKAGDEVLLLDGEGTTANCRIAKVERKKIFLEIGSISRTPPPASKADIALALSKAARRGFLMEKASEFGAWRILLWRAAYSQGTISQHVLQACKNQLIAGLKQSRNPWLPRLEAVDGIGSLDSYAAQADHRILLWEAQTGVPMLEPPSLGRKGTTAFVIGPEGGFHADETAWLFGHDFEAFSLGNRVLRCETAAALCLGLHWWACQLPAKSDAPIIP